MEKKVKDVVFIALYAALFVVLDYITTYFNILKMPSGGSLSLGSVILLLSSYQLGIKKSSIVCLISIFLMFVIGSITFYGIVSFILDYFLAYMAYCLAVLFKNYKFFYLGIVIVNMIRLICSTISGCVIWETEIWASIVYNASYIMPTMFLDLIMVPLLHTRIKKIWH